MIKNFRHCERKYATGHRFVQKMLNATVACGLALNQLQASDKLKYWLAKLCKDLENKDLEIGNQQSHGPIGRQSVTQQLALMNHTIGE
jgi:hypothetical protein